MKLPHLNSSPRFADQFRAIFLGLAATVLSASASDVSWKQIQFGGFASQGYLLSSANDYLGKTSEGTFDFREYALNASWSSGKWRLGAQAFGQKLGAYGDDKIKLDWATIDYQATQWFGVRAGKVKMPRGLYNEALDVDSVRPFVLLPQSVYDSRLRDFNAAFDGAMIYGNVGLPGAGSFDYRLFYGNIPTENKSGAHDYFNNDFPFEQISLEMEGVYGGTLFWNTPLSGLRVGYSYSALKELISTRYVRIPAARIDDIRYRLADTYNRHLLSAEYTTGDWTFATEAGIEKTVHAIGIAGGAPLLGYDFESSYFYASAARHINRWLELGAYYSSSVDTNKAKFGKTFALPDRRQTDCALSARFDISEQVLFKIEGHYLDGAGKLFDTFAHHQSLAQADTSWTMVAAKMTFSF